MEFEALRNSLWTDVEKDKTLRGFPLQDAACDPRIHPNMVISQMDNACLHEGRIPLVLTQAAPHLVRLAAAASYTRWFLEEGWGNHWGVRLQSKANLPALRAQYQRLLPVKNEAGGRFFCKSETGAEVSAYDLVEGKLRIIRISMPSSPLSAPTAIQLEAGKP